MCKCKRCERLISEEPIKVIDWKHKSPFVEDLYHFEDGYRCTYNGHESLNIEELEQFGCCIR